MRVTWTRIPYTEGPGGYEVSYATTAGGPFTIAGLTADKKVSTFDIEGLSSSLLYHFVVRTITQPCEYNENLVASDYSLEVSAAVVVPPNIAMVVPLSEPYRLKIIGSGFHEGCTIMIDGTPVPQTKWVRESVVFAKKGSALKELLPKGVAVSIEVRNNDDHGISASYTFTR